jgi:hypothetical protein
LDFFNFDLKETKYLEKILDILSEMRTLKTFSLILNNVRASPQMVTIWKFLRRTVSQNPELVSLTLFFVRLKISSEVLFQAFEFHKSLVEFCTGLAVYRSNFSVREEEVSLLSE